MRVMIYLLSNGTTSRVAPPETCMTPPVTVRNSRESFCSRRRRNLSRPYSRGATAGDTAVCWRKHQEVSFALQRFHDGAVVGCRARSRRRCPDAEWAACAQRRAAAAVPAGGWVRFVAVWVHGERASLGLRAPPGHLCRVFLRGGPSHQLDRIRAETDAVSCIWRDSDRRRRGSGFTESLGGNYSSWLPEPINNM